MRLYPNKNQTESLEKSVSDNVSRYGCNRSWSRRIGVALSGVTAFCNQITHTPLKPPCGAVGNIYGHDDISSQPKHQILNFGSFTNTKITSDTVS